MRLNINLLLLASLIQSYREYTIDQGLLQQSFGQQETDWYRKTKDYYYSLDRAFFESAGIRQNEWHLRVLLHFDITKEISQTAYSGLDAFHFPDKSTMEETVVSSFFYYMWNAWSEKECKTVYGNEYLHFWDKWRCQAGNTSSGAAEKFYADLSGHYRMKLVGRACELYRGGERIRQG